MLTKYVTMVLYNYRCNKKYKTFNNYSSSYLSTQCAYYILNMEVVKESEFVSNQDTFG